MFLLAKRYKYQKITHITSRITHVNQFEYKYLVKDDFGNITQWEFGGIPPKKTLVFLHYSLTFFFLKRSKSFLHCRRERQDRAERFLARKEKFSVCFCLVALSQKLCVYRCNFWKIESRSRCEDL